MALGPRVFITHLMACDITSVMFMASDAKFSCPSPRQPL
jgi:hypothetical protein